MENTNPPVPTTFALCWGWEQDGQDCSQRDDDRCCYACASHFDEDPA